ncbi:hypothetical protein HAX54_019381, partial [Datura stramonium]|nr:hypothetical protein [Datura stramonium]
ELSKSKQCSIGESPDMPGETPAELQFQARGYRPLQMPCVSPALRGSGVINRWCGTNS